MVSGKEASMRILLLTAAAALLPQASTAAPPKVGGNLFDPTIESSIKTPPSECRRPSAYIADDRLVWRDDKLQPRKLTELPPALGFMAVYRGTNGCEDPMTMVEYRTGRRG